MRNASDGPTTDAGSDWRHGGMSRRRNGEWWRIRLHRQPIAARGTLRGARCDLQRLFHIVLGHGQYCWRTKSDRGRVERRRKGRRRRRRPIAARSGQFRRRCEGRSYGGGGSWSCRRRTTTASTRSTHQRRRLPAQGARARGRRRRRRQAARRRGGVARESSAMAAWLEKRSHKLIHESMR